MNLFYMGSKSKKNNFLGVGEGMGGRWQVRGASVSEFF